MDGALRTRRGPRVYLSPAPAAHAGHGAPPGAASAGKEASARRAASPAVNARSRMLAAALRPADTPSHEILHATAAARAARLQARAAEARAAELEGCTFQPELQGAMGSRGSGYGGYGGHGGGAYSGSSATGGGMRTPPPPSRQRTVRQHAEPRSAPPAQRSGVPAFDVPSAEGGRGVTSALGLQELEQEVRDALAGVQLTSEELRQVMEAAGDVHSVGPGGGVTSLSPIAKSTEEVLRQLLADSS
eukprot:353843-Chlamydomonas_euryale.AAC.12